jgi:predicted ferric reductase
LYVSLAGSGFDTYTLSIACGITAYALICDQFILAARPRFLVGLFGAKGLQRLHAHIPVGIVLLAALHPVLKELNGFSDETLQARLGTTTLVLLIAAIVFTVLFMANTVWMKISPLSEFRKWIYKKTGLTYKGARIAHNLLVIAAVFLAVHVLLASTSAFSANPVGMIWMAVWMVLSLGLYLGYRLSGRNPGKTR